MHLMVPKWLIVWQISVSKIKLGKLTNLEKMLFFWLKNGIFHTKNIYFMFLVFKMEMMKAFLGNP